MSYKEPKVSYLVLDYNKPLETRVLLDSIKHFTKFNHKVIYLHNGYNQSAYRFMDLGLVDQLVMTKKNNGLGVGTRDLFAACFSEYAIYVQNDQFLGREFSEAELDSLILGLEQPSVKSISLAGAPCGLHIYSERAHIIKTSLYKSLELFGSEEGPMPNGGAGPYHTDPWREGWIQNYYKKHKYFHFTYNNPLFGDNGTYAVRENPDGSVWFHRTDNKKLWNIVVPKEKNSSYPKLTDEEWSQALAGKWVNGTVPRLEQKDSFQHWSQTPADDEDYAIYMKEKIWNKMS